MESSLIKIRSLYNEMGRGEKRIADYILSHPEETVTLSVSQLAKICDCGSATLVRFSKRLGLTGFAQLKISIARQIGGQNESIGISKQDDCFDIYTKRMNEIALALEKTKGVLDRTALQRAAVNIIKSNRILIFGLGNSAAIAMDAQHKFMRAGLNATAYSDNHLQAIAASHTTEGEVVIGISHSGASKDIVEGLRLAKLNGSRTICITNFAMSPLVKESDIVLYTNAEETKYSILALSSRIAQLAIIDALYSFVVLNFNEAAQLAINETETALTNKKI